MIEDDPSHGGTVALAAPREHLVPDGKSTTYTDCEMILPLTRSSKRLLYLHSVHSIFVFSNIYAKKSFDRPGASYIRLKHASKHVLAASPRIRTGELGTPRKKTRLNYSEVAF